MATSACPYNMTSTSAVMRGGLSYRFGGATSEQECQTSCEECEAEPGLSRQGSSPRCSLLLKPTRSLAIRSMIAY